MNNVIDEEHSAAHKQFLELLECTDMVIAAIVYFIAKISVYNLGHHIISHIKGTVNPSLDEQSCRWGN